MTNINIALIPKEWTRFQRNLVPSPKCKNCEKKCTILYDSHHDEYFSVNCGLVIIEQGHYKIPYTINYTHHNKQKRKKTKKRKN